MQAIGWLIVVDAEASFFKSLLLALFAFYYIYYYCDTSIQSLFDRVVSQF